MEKLEIHLDNSSSTYFPGQLLTGKLQLNIQKPQFIKSIDIRAHGESATYWKHYNTTFREHIVFSSKTVHLDDLTKPWKAEKNNDTILPGNHIFSFAFQVPQECPGSFEGKHGSIRYKIQADAIGKKKWETETMFSVLSYLDLNRVPRALMPVEDKKFTLHSSKNVEIEATIPQRGYIAGETIPLSVEIKNATSTSIKKLSMKLIQIVHFEAQQDTGHMFKEHFKFHHNTIENEILEVRENVNIKGSLETMKFDLVIPKETQSSFKTKLIQVAYKILVTPGNDKKLECELPLIVGTIQVQPEPPTYETAVKSSEGCPPVYQG